LSFWLKKIVDFNRYLPIIAIVFIFVCAYLVKHFYNIKNLYFLGGFHIIYIAPFLLGMVLAKYHKYLLQFISAAFLNSINSKLFVFLPYCLITIFITYKTLYSQNITQMTFVLLFSLPFLLYICNVLEKFISAKTITFLGTFSFFIYLYNYAYMVFNPLLKFQHKSTKAFACFVVILIVAYIFYFINKQILKFISKIKSK
jgi:hypothetical protein